MPSCPAFAVGVSTPSLTCRITAMRSRCLRLLNTICPTHLTTMARDVIFEDLPSTHTT